MTYQRISYGGTNLSEEQQQAFLRAIQSKLPTAGVYSYKEADVDPEGAAEFKSQLRLWDVFVEVPLDLVGWLQSEIATIVAEGFDLDLMEVEAYGPQAFIKFKRQMSAHRVPLPVGDEGVQTEPELVND